MSLTVRRTRELSMSAQGFIDNISKKLSGAIPLTGDCRSFVARKLRDSRSEHRFLVVLGPDGALDATHVLLTDARGKVTADSYNGRLVGDHYEVITPAGRDELRVMLRVPVSAVAHFEMV